MDRAVIEAACHRFLTVISTAHICHIINSLGDGYLRLDGTNTARIQYKS